MREIADVVDGIHYQERGGLRYRRDPAPFRETASLTDCPFGGNLILTSYQHRRLDEALEQHLPAVPPALREPLRDRSGRRCSGPPLLVP
jgi:hypothetical protein